MSEPPAELRVDGRIRASAGGFVARIRLADAAGDAYGERALETESHRCAELSRALVLAMALMLQSPLRDPPVPVRVEPESREVEVPRERSRAPTPPLWLGAAIEGELRLGAWSDAGAGGRLRVSLAGDHWSAFAAVTLAASVVRLSEPGVEVFFWDAVLGGCGGAPVEGVSLQGCAAVALGRARGEGRGLASVTAGAAWVPSGQASVRVEGRPLPWLRWGLELGADVALRDVRFTYTDASGRERTAFDPWPVSPFVRLSLGMRAPP
ncbi:MAG TPA: hypothetical protein RMH99_16340 [Sandaracinaceae bacterium LLY-WYZ-13_1]|nr:hypothetical protein [Sandaracinaceae bacterium LLY-WYZ-13_1]